MALIATLGLLALLALPAAATGERKSRALQCLSNFRRLSLAWTLFPNDYNGVLVGNTHGGEAQNPIPQIPKYQSWANGWLDWGTSPHNTNTAYLVDDRYAALAAYVGHDATLFRCPEDVFVSGVQRARHWSHRARSYSCNVAVGPGNAETGPWESTFRHVTRLSDFAIPGPSDSMVFLEEHPDSITDPAFFPPRPTQWLDLPASYHNGATFFTFADGHATLIRWKSPATVQPIRLSSYGGSTVPATDPDVRWFRFHTPRRSDQY